MTEQDKTIQEFRRRFNYLKGWIDREHQNVESQLSAAISEGKVQGLNYVNGKLYEIKLIKELFNDGKN